MAFAKIVAVYERASVSSDKLVFELSLVAVFIVDRFVMVQGFLCLLVDKLKE